MFKRLVIIISVVAITIGYFTQDLCIEFFDIPWCLGSLLILFGIVLLISLLIYVFGSGCGMGFGGGRR